MNKEKAETLLENYQALSELYSNIRKELDRTKKKLDICVSALTVIAEGLVVEHQVVGHEDDNKIFIAKHTLEQINQKEEK